jgi:Flp pilus assembly protein TadG
MRTSAYPVRLPFGRAHIPRRPYFGGGEHGATLVETALSLTILLTLLMGLMNLSLLLFSFHYIAEAAREGTRYAIVRGSACSGLSHCPNATQTDISNYIKGLGFPGINPAALTVTATWPTTGASCTPSLTPCNNPGNLVKVTVLYQFPFSLPFVPSRLLNLTSTSQMVISQ